MANWIEADVVKFQFHNGSIKSHDESVQSNRSQQFQFHNGSIKSGICTRLYNLPIASFNSTMVRLKGRSEGR